MEKLLGLLHRVFVRDPESFLALRLSYDGQMNWEVKDGGLITAVSGGSGSPLSISLSGHSIASLAAYIAAQPGYSTPYVDVDNSSRSALILINSSGVQGASNGDHVYGFSSLLWVIIGAWAEALNDVKIALVSMVDQLNVTLAAGDWLNEWGWRFSNERIDGETDVEYSARLVAEVLQVRTTNKALEQVIFDATGIVVDVVDIDWRDGPSNNLAMLGITTIAPGTFPTGGYPYWGSPVNDNPLVCAFAIILHLLSINDVDPVVIAQIKRIVDSHRAAGTVGLYFGPSGTLLHTNTSIEVTNSLGYVCGPSTGQYVQINV